MQLRRPNTHVLGVMVVGLLFTAAAMQDTPVQSAFGLGAAFIVMPLLASALLEERLSVRSLTLGTMFAVVLLIAIGLTASAFQVEERAAVSRWALAALIAGAGIGAAWARRGGWALPARTSFQWRPRRYDAVALVAGAGALIASIAVALATPNRPTSYIAMSVTMQDGKIPPTVIEGKAGSSTSVVVEIQNAMPSNLAAQLVVTGPGWIDAQSLQFSAGAERAIPVAIPFATGESTVTLELHSDNGDLDRLVVMQLRGT